MSRSYHLCQQHMTGCLLSCLFNHISLARVGSARSELPISPLWPRGVVTCGTSESLALLLGLSGPHGYASRGCARVCCCVWGAVSQFAGRPGAPRKRRGQGWKIPPPQKKKKKMCEFIAASLGQRSSGLSLPRDTIISWAPSREKYGLKTQRKS